MYLAKRYIVYAVNHVIAIEDITNPFLQYAVKNQTMQNHIIKTLKLLDNSNYLFFYKDKKNWKNEEWVFAFLKYYFGKEINVTNLFKENYSLYYRIIKMGGVQKLFKKYGIKAVYNTIIPLEVLIEELKEYYDEHQTIKNLYKDNERLRQSLYYHMRKFNVDRETFMLEYVLKDR